MSNTTENLELHKTIEMELTHGSKISIVSVINCLIEYAKKIGASDIHIDPTPTHVSVRLRVDGVLQNTFTFPKHIHSEIISRIKIISKLRTDEHQATQDGRFRHIVGSVGDTTDNFVDMRVSIMPTYHGENAVLRLLIDTGQSFTLESLGFNPSDREKIGRALQASNGMILTTGPTGSGKTTTLYTLIKMLNTPEVSIITIEDPIEYAMEGVEQIQVSPRHGLTFGNGLRSILRQDPNIIMVGEIRDAETARIAINTALTGHLLLSTLHTSDAATTLPRLLDMGIEEYLVASTVSIAIGQRLVRKICIFCKKKIEVSEILKENILKSIEKGLLVNTIYFYKGAGCDACNGSGYTGRISINEVLVSNEEIKEAILRKCSAHEIRKIAIKNGMTTMFQDGIHKASEGLTTVDEIFRVISE